MNGFEALAQYYDRFVGADYERIISFIDRKIKVHFPTASLVCDVGCGSGTVTFGLAEKGYDMIGVDGSMDMLAEAMDKRADYSNGQEVLLLLQQLPEFELYGTVDVIVSTLDTVNYLSGEEDLDRLFYWFQNYLNPNGILIFDINTLYKYQTLLNNHCEVYDTAEVFLSWRSAFDGQLCSHQLSFFEKDGAVYRRREEEQQQRYFSSERIEQLFKKYNFELLETCDDYSDQQPNPTTQRITYIVRKRSNE